MRKPNSTIEPPVMSWDRPIEDIILEYVRGMKRSWRVQQTANIWGSVRKEAKSIIMAYESVEDYIVREKKLRADIEAGRLQRKKDVRANTKLKSELAPKSKNIKAKGE